MGLLCSCPQGSEIGNIPISECFESVGQIQKIVFQRLYKDDGSKNKFIAATANPNLLASWTPLLAATDSTKVVQTPFISQPENEPGASRTYGGGNATIGGIELVIGREPTAFTSMILRNNQETIKALKSYQCENVGVYFVDEYGRLLMLGDGLSTIVDYFPIPIAGLFVGDKKLGGLEDIDSNALEFKLFPNWSDELQVITPTDFDALNDLKTP